jgi:hypothetical protein
MRVAAVTMVWNEPDFLPIWRRHYERQVGAANCIVIDHGSDDGSAAGVTQGSVIRLPRSPLEEVTRAHLVSSLASGLLGYYDAVIYTDVDELLVADPEHYAGLVDFCAKCPFDVVTTIGLDVLHSTQDEPAIDPLLPISLQRSWVRFVSPMCKASIIRRPVIWAPGFHNADSEIRFDRLFTFHLRWFDLERGLKRLRKTRTMARAFPWIAEHQAIPDEQFANSLIYGMRDAPRRDDVTLNPDASPLKEWLDRITGEQAARAGEMYRLDLGLVEPAAWRLPARFRGLF